MEDRQVRVLLEDIDHKFKAILELTSDNPERFERVEKKIDQLQEDMAIVKTSPQLKVNVSEVEKVKKDINILQKRFAS